MEIPQFILDSKKISFDEKLHEYSIQGKKFISVTTFLDLFKPPFDEDGSILKKCAQNEGVSEEELQKRWHTKRDKASDIGNKIHDQIEGYINTGKIKKNKFTEIVKKFSNFDFRGQIFSEVIIYDEDMLISGTADLVQLEGNVVRVHDLKTNEKKPNYYSYKKFLKEPLDHIPAGKLNLYELQISLYLYLLSSKYGYEIGSPNYIFWIDRKKNNIEKILVEPKIDEVISLLSYWSYQKSLEEINVSDNILKNNVE